MEAPVRPAPELRAPSRIGERLREERTRQGITVREIARRVGVSPSLISQIERDKVNPSVSTLWNLVTVLGLTMGELFPDAETARRALAADGRRTDDGPGHRAVINLETGVRWERLTSGSDPLVEFLTVEYPPGAASCDEDSLVRHGGKEYGYVVRGRSACASASTSTSSALHGDLVRRVGPAPPVGDRRSTGRAIWVVVGRQNDTRGRADLVRNRAEDGAKAVAPVAHDVVGEQRRFLGASLAAGRRRLGARRARCERSASSPAAARAARRRDPYGRRDR
jgi:transcriptional regulator with XRE-family HTH domain